MQVRKLMFTFALLMFVSATCMAQQAPASFAGSLVRSATPSISTDAASRTMPPSAQVLVHNRARVYGDRVAANGTRYFYLSDSALRGKTPDELLRSLSPAAVVASEKVREIQSVVNLNHPLTLYADRDQSIDIGTAIIQGVGSKNVEAHTSIVMQRLTILPK